MVRPSAMLCGARPWSPEQIARRVDGTRRDGATGSSDGTGATGASSSHPIAAGQDRSFTPRSCSVSDRPRQTTARSRALGGDLILGLGSSAIGTLVERTSRHDAAPPPPPCHPASPGPRTVHVGHGAAAVREGSLAITTLPGQRSDMGPGSRDARTTSHRWPSTSATRKARYGPETVLSKALTSADIPLTISPRRSRSQQPPPQDPGLENPGGPLTITEPDLHVALSAPPLSHLLPSTTSGRF